MFVRACIVLLLVLNLGVAGWWLLHAEPATAPLERDAMVPRLQLVAEAPAEPAATVAQARPAKTMATLVGVAPAPAIAGAGDATGSPQCTGTVDDTQGWRVFLPRLPSPDAARAMAARIAAAGFSDYLVMRDGDDANAIALGRYGTREAAQRRVKALHAAGFPARCARIPASTPA